MNTSIDMTNVTGISTNRSPGQQRHSQDETAQNSMGKEGVFNFAPNTQRTHNVNIDTGADPGSVQDSLIQDLQPSKFTKEGSMNQYGELSNKSGSKSGYTPNNPSNANQQKGKAVAQLQPKLIHPPQKMAKTIEYQGVKASHIKKKTQGTPQYF